MLEDSTCKRISLFASPLSLKFQSPYLRRLPCTPHYKPYTYKVNLWCERKLKGKKWASNRFFTDNKSKPSPGRKREGVEEASDRPTDFYTPFEESRVPDTLSASRTDSLPASSPSEEREAAVARVIAARQKLRDPWPTFNITRGEEAGTRLIIGRRSRWRAPRWYR